MNTMNLEGRNYIGQQESAGLMNTYMKRGFCSLVPMRMVRMRSMMKEES